MSVSLILLSGGIGQRMGTEIPKQYLPLGGKPVVLHALDSLLPFFDWQEVIIVCDPRYQNYFENYDNLQFATPGETRAESVFSGFDALRSPPDYLCIHDGARPFVPRSDLASVLQEGFRIGAAALAVPVPYTIKEKKEDGLVEKTLDRSRLYMMQTPQVIKTTHFVTGRSMLPTRATSVTDDVMLAELAGEPVTLVPGSDINIKITNPVDRKIAELLLHREDSFA